MSDIRQSSSSERSAQSWSPLQRSDASIQLLSAQRNSVDRQSLGPTGTSSVRHQYTVRQSVGTGCVQWSINPPNRCPIGNVKLPSSEWFKDFFSNEEKTTKQKHIRLRAVNFTMTDSVIDKLATGKCVDIETN